MAMLQKRYTTKQWLSFVCLAIGASLANLSVSDTQDKVADDRSQYIGILCILAATCTSGFAGVFMEKQLKQSRSLYVKNIQLGMFGFLMCFVNSYVTGDLHDIVIPYGFLHGFTRSTWLVVVLNIFGGYLVAFVLKRASNIIKSFAAGLAVILIVLGSYYFFGTNFSGLFYIGAILVLGGNGLYQREEIIKRRRATTPLLPT
eukprot:264006_1